MQGTFGRHTVIQTMHIIIEQALRVDECHGVADQSVAKGWGVQGTAAGHWRLFCEP